MPQSQQNKVSLVKNNPVLFANDLVKLEQDAAEKKEFWLALKQHI